jgi:hypothetical protein
MAAFSATVAWGQTGTASIVGEVTDAQGAVIVGAKVTITHIETKSSRTVETDSTGSYQFASLIPGIYSVRVEMQGFRTAVVEKLELLVNTSTRTNIKLEVGQITETVTISEAALALNVTDATIGNVITPKQVMSLPLEGRSPSSLLVLQSGVAFSGDFGDTRSGSVSGARSDQSNVTLDGVSINDQQTQNTFEPALPVPLGTIQEFRFTTSNPTADQGRSSGGQVAFVTKSGTNEFHGNAYWLHRNTATTANDFFNKQTSPAVSVPKLIRNQFGGSFGGPFIKERIFFFGAYEGMIRREETNVLRIVPSNTLRQGQLLYRDAGGAVVTLQPADVQTIDPAGIGVNPAMITVLQGYPQCNDLNQGLDQGLNFCGFRFNSPLQANQNIWVAKFDFHITRDARHTVSWRGTLNDLAQDFTPQQFPGQPIAQQLLDNSKGMAASYTAQLSSNWTNIFRWGLTRQGFEISGQIPPAFGIRSFDNPYSSARATLRNVPEHNLVDDMTWVKGSHAFQFGGNFRFINNNRNSFANAFSGYFINDGFCQGLCNSIFANVTAAGFPAVPTASRNPFKRAVMALYGTITQLNTAAFFNGSTNVLASGQGAAREFIYRESELYVQDTWRLTRELTVTLGLRYGFYGVPYEKSGLQTGTTNDIGDFIEQRARAQQLGLASNSVPLLSWDLIGKENGKPGYYEPDKNNFAPSVSFAYSPNFSGGWLGRMFGTAGKSAIRGGYRVVYDRIGGAMVVTQDLNGSIGLVSPLSNRTGTLNYSGPVCTPPATSPCAAPRFSGFGSLPNVANFVTVPAAGFPATPPQTIANRGFAIDQGLRTPYSHAFQFSFARELPGAMTLEASYVSRLGQKLLAKADIAAPLIYLLDPASGQTYALAINTLFIQSGRGALDPLVLADLNQIQPIPYFENLFAGLAGFCTASATCTATQAVYEFASTAFPSFTDSLLNIECGTVLSCPTFFQQQFDSLPAWNNLGRSNYHALQASLRKRFTHGLTFDFNYAWSKSMDNASAIENVGRLTGQIADIFNPRNNYSLSSFDVQHQLSTNWVYELPFGRGRRFGSDVNSALDQVIGGWQTSGIVVWRTGFPLSVENGFNFPTNFFLTGPGTVVCPMRTNFTTQGFTGNTAISAAPNLFGNQAAVQAAFNCLDFTPSGSSGARNTLRGVRFTNVDFGMRKTFRMPWEGHTFQFDWHAFNLFNHPNFDDRDMRLNPESFGTFGVYVSTIGQDLRNNNARVMQFGLSYRF